MPLYEYRCGAHMTEARRGYGVAQIACPRCQQPAQRSSVYLTTNITESAPVPLSDRRYNVSRFKEASEELAYDHDKAETQAGKKLSAPDLYQIGRRHAEGSRKVGTQKGQEGQAR